MTVKTRQSLAISLCLAAATFFAYWGVLSADFINFDDAQYLTENPAVKAGLTQNSIKWAFTSGYAGNWHPLTWLSHMLDWQLYGTKAGMHHLTGLLIHAANAILIFTLLSWVTGAVWRSALVAALFGLHPVHVESVAWVAERKDVLSTFFWLLTSLAYVGYVRRPGWGRYCLVLFLFALGLMSKPMVVTLPVILLLMDVWPLKRLNISLKPAGEKGDSWLSRLPDNGRRIVLEKIPLLLMAAISSWITIQVQVGGGAVILTHLSMVDRFSNALITYVRYLGNIFWPSKLSIFYPYIYDWTIWHTVGAAFLICCISLITILLAKQRPFLLTGWFWYLITLLPTIGIIQVGEQSMADRYTYIPSIGLSIMLVWGILELLARVPRMNWILGATASLVLTGFMWGTIQQVGYWKNSVTLFSHALDVTERNAVAHFNLGQALSEVGRREESIEHYRKALLIEPKAHRVHNNLGLALASQGNFEEAIQHYETALALYPTNIAPHFNYGVTLVATLRFDDAVQQFKEVLRLDPNNAMAHGQLGRIYNAKGMLGEANHHLSQSLQLDPQQPESHYNFGMLLEHQGDFHRAGMHFEEALKYRTNYFEAYAHLAAIKAAEGRFNEAIANYREALRLQPDSLELLNNLAWILAANADPAIRNGAEAVNLAQKACELTSFKEPLLLGTLGAALAEAGRFSEAVTTATTAMELALASNLNLIAEKNQQLLKLYQSGRAYHEEAHPGTIQEVKGAPSQ